MKISKTILILISTFSYLFLTAGDPKAPLPITNKVTLSNGTVFDDRLNGFFVVGYTENTTIGASFNQDEITLFEIGNDGNLIRMVETELVKYKEHKRTISKVIILENQIYVFSEIVDRKADIYVYLVEAFDFKDLKPSGKVIPLEEIQFEKRRNKGSFAISISPDEKKLLLYKDLPYDKEGKEKYELTLFDGKINKLWSSEIEMPYTDKEISIQNFYVDNDGDVIISSKKWSELKSKDVPREERKANFKYEYILLFVSEKGKDIKEFEIDIEKKWLTDIKFEILPEGKIVGAGFYSENVYGIKGVFFVAIDKYTRKITKYSLKEFSLDFMYAKLSEKKKEKAVKKEAEGKGRGLLQFNFRDLVVRDDGGVILLAEQSYVVVNCTTDPKTGARTCTYTYYYNDIVVVNINPSGDIEWANWIPKRQISRSPYFFSYHLHVRDDKMHIMFNDNIKNYSLPQDQLISKMKAWGGKKPVITFVTMNLKGDQEREVLFLKDVNGLTMVPNVSRQIDDGKSILFFQKARKKRFTLIKF